MTRVLAAAALALCLMAGETVRERYERLAASFFRFEAVEDGAEPRLFLTERIVGAGGHVEARTAPGDFATEASSLCTRAFDCDVRLPAAALAKAFLRLEALPHPLTVLSATLERTEDGEFRGPMRVEAAGLDPEVHNDAEAERMIGSMDAFLAARTRWSAPVAIASAAADGASIAISAVRLDATRMALDVRTGSAEAVAALVMKLASDSTMKSLFAKPEVKGAGASATIVLARKAPRSLRQEGVTRTASSPRPREPRPRLRPAREVLIELGERSLRPVEDLRNNKPREELQRALGAFGAADPEGLPLVAQSGGALPGRTYDARVRLWWDELPEVAARAMSVTAAAIVGFELHEVPPPSDEYRYKGKRVLRLEGTIRVAVLGFDRDALGPDDAAGEAGAEPRAPASAGERAQEGVERAKRFLATRDEVVAPLAAALTVLPPQVVVERLAATAERLEVRLAGVDEKEAAAYAATVADLVPVAALFGEPALSRQADTWIIGLDRKD